MNKYIVAVLLVIIAFSCEAAVTTGTLKGTIVFGGLSLGDINPSGARFNLFDDRCIQANILLSQNGKVITGGVSQINGVFKIEDIEPGMYKVSFQSIAFKTIDYLYVSIKADEISYLYPEMKVDASYKEPLGSHGYLTGVVSDSTGTKLANAKILIIKDEAEIASGKSQENGEYAIANLTPGYCTIRVSADGYKPMKYIDFTIEGRQTTKLDVTLSLEK